MNGLTCCLRAGGWLWLCGILAGAPALGAPAPQPQFSAADLREDAYVSYDALRTLHPGLDRYLSDEDFDRNYQELRREYARGADLPGAYLAMARFLASIRCGHTWLNPLNQTDPVAEALLNRPDRLPLHFSVVGRRFLVTRAMDGSGVRRGTEILALDGVPSARIIERLWPYLRADGASDGKRLAQIGNEGGASAFDEYYGLIAPPHSSVRMALLRAPDGEVRRARIGLITEAARERALALQPGAPTRAWDYRREGDVAVITMPTWAFWNQRFDWQAWLDKAFVDMSAQHVDFLVIDLRDNEGGDGAIGEALARRLVQTPSRYTSHLPHLVYDVVPQRLRAVLSTWDRSFYDQRPRVEALGPRDFTLREREPEEVELAPAAGGFRGKTYVLIGPNDSSATYEFARVVHDARLATLLGQPTGGNLRGINGGNMFFLRLPRTGITVDLPVIAWKARTPQPDSPVMPDVRVAPDFAARARGEDPEMRAAFALIAHERESAAR